jgi:CheY-like chemotaxis protein
VVLPLQPILAKTQHEQLDLSATPIRSAIILDDSIDAAQQLARYLEELSAQVTIECHSNRAIERVTELQPEVVFLDLLMPGMSGWEILAKLKQNPQTQSIPVIIVSVADERDQARKAGAAELLVKPVTREQLRSALVHARSTHHATPAKTSTPTQSTPLLLLAEDNPINQEGIRDYLQAKGYRVIVAADGRQAVALAIEHHPDLILMDVQMPHVDGIEAMRQLRALPDFATTPIIALTALAMSGDRERCLAAGATEYMAKPIRFKDLTELIQALIHLP